MQSSTVDTVPLGAQPHILQSNRGSTNDKKPTKSKQQCLLVNHKQQPQLEQLKNKVQKQN